MPRKGNLNFSIFMSRIIFLSSRIQLKKIVYTRQGCLKTGSSLFWTFKYFHFQYIHYFLEYLEVFICQLIWRDIQSWREMSFSVPDFRLNKWFVARKLWIDGNDKSIATGLKSGLESRTRLINNNQRPVLANMCRNCCSERLFPSNSCADHWSGAQHLSVAQHWSVVTMNSH